jgi:hypothetical protein
MLEAGGVLQTYRLDVPPARLAGEECTATKIHDHPLRFLTYQGSVNKGLGSVRLADSGSYTVIEESAESYLLNFIGKTLMGEFRLMLVEENRWNFKRCENGADS